MTRILVSSILFLILFFVETGLISALQAPLATTPLVFASAVYLIQHQGARSAAWWLPIYGSFLGLLHISVAPFEFLSYSAVSFITVFSARHIFSNRSFYGVCACLLTSYLSLAILQSAFLFLHTTITHRLVDWSVFLQFHTERILMLLLMILVLFPLAKRIRQLLVKTFLVPMRQQTY